MSSICDNSKVLDPIMDAPVFQFCPLFVIACSLQTSCKRLLCVAPIPITLTKVDEKLTISFPLMRRQGHNAWQIVIQQRLFFLCFCLSVPLVPIRDIAMPWPFCNPSSLLPNHHITYLWKIAHKMTSMYIGLRENVKQKGLNIIIQGLVVQKHLRQ